jgi:hypothetical protein
VSLGATTTGDMVIAGGDDGTVYRGAGCESRDGAGRRSVDPWVRIIPFSV